MVYIHLFSLFYYPDYLTISTTTTLACLGSPISGATLSSQAFLITLAISACIACLDSVDALATPSCLIFSCSFVFIFSLFSFFFFFFSYIDIIPINTLIVKHNLWIFQKNNSMPNENNSLRNSLARYLLGRDFFAFGTAFAVGI